MPISPYQVREPIVETKTRLVTTTWERWLRELTDALNHAPRVVGQVSLLAQAASLPPTPISTPALTGGLYRVSVAVHITKAASTSSSLTVTLGWTDGGTPISLAGTAVVGNTVTTVQSDSVLLNVDTDTAITYATTYATSGVAQMEYALHVMVEKLP
jgi:hypothetical protein